ncbi:DUF5994 family protein [Tsukamurella soli]|uniref:DUF5994 family protein n=1 Tax=Tsukamurella soli TaxID=644556 RepID=A0ABP8JRN4_9ACTN
MTQLPHAARPTPRLRLSPEPAPGRQTHARFDGAWWPRTHDLEAELVDVIPLLDARVTRVERVCYPIADWTDTPKRLMTGHRRLDLDGYNYQATGTVRFAGPDDTVVLAVVAPEAEPESAAWELQAALDSHEHRTADELSRAAGPASRAQATDRSATAQWENDGGGGDQAPLASDYIPAPSPLAGLTR